VEAFQGRALIPAAAFHEHDGARAQRLVVRRGPRAPVDDDEVVGAGLGDVAIVYPLGLRHRNVAVQDGQAQVGVLDEAEGGLGRPVEDHAGQRSHAGPDLEHAARPDPLKPAA
jgi:hypothetical protein